ncbi:MAG: TonB-dependent receptor [Bryobacterales bacterium]|nr:TonB-dependent receptor [Bryobacterales bacterium]
MRADFTRDLATWLPRWWTNSLYFQDDWKLTPQITLNLGVRWQYETPYRTKYDQQSQFSPTATDPLTGRQGALLHPAGALAGRDLKNFQPRVGMAYSFRRNWVFRGGFAVNTLDLWTNGLQENFEEYLATTVVQPPPGDPDVAFYLSKGPPPIRMNIQPNGTSPFVGTNYSGRNASYYDPNMRSPYIMNWNAGFQWQMASNMLVELSYQGSAGVGLLNRWDINVIPLNIATSFADLDRIRRAAQNYKPYPHFGSIYNYGNYGHNTYHSGTLRFEKRYSRGLSLTSFYTWAKAIDEFSNDGGASGVTFYNRSLEKARADYDVAHRWVTYVTYELPVGRGRAFLNDAHWLLNGFLGDWNLAVIQSLETGAPFGFTQTGSSNVYLPMVQRPDMAPGKTYGDIRIPWDRHGPCRHTVACALPWADINAFAYPPSFTPGQAGRNIINGPGMIWHQVSLAKRIPVGERIKGMLRVDVNNPFKRPFFAAPNSAVNFRNPQAFGKITSSQGSYSGIGGRTYIYAIFKLEF